jgi:hypothetical protein
MLDEQDGASFPGARVNVTAESRARMLSAAAHAIRSIFPSSKPSTSQYPMPPSPHRLTGSLLMANRCPARSLKSFGISQRAIRSGLVSARHTRSAGQGMNSSTRSTRRLSAC